MEEGGYKERANTAMIMNGKEEIEAANIAKRKRVGHNDAPTLKCVSWKQTENDVTIVLEASTKLDTGDIDPELTDTEVRVSLQDGTRWQCTFNQAIEQEATNLTLQGSKVTIKVKKKHPNKHWPSLELAGGKEKKPIKTENDATSVDKIETSVRDTKKEPVHKLTHVNHDWFEKSNEELAVPIYVKQVNKESVRVKFEDKRFTAYFCSSDHRFLSMYEGTSETTVFSWSVDVVDTLKVEKCRHKITNSAIELLLVKKTPRRWCALDASQVKGSSHVRSSTSSTNASSSAWVPASKNLSNNKTKGITTTDQSKVMFDEMCNSTVSSSPTVAVTASSTNVTTTTTTTAPVVSEAKVTDNRQAKKSPPPPGDALTDKASKTKLKVSPKPSSKDSNKETVSQKPTCMVSPLNKNLSERSQVVNLGMTGLDNLGNTCFQNSVLQVLANIRELRDYFLESHFQKDINVENPLGMGGKLAVAFAFLLKVLWSGKHHSYPPVKLKNLIAMKNSLFTGFAQHDAQEFMAFLLDGLHEDLNRVRDKPYTTTVDSDGRKDEVVAEEAWRVHKQRNDSFIVDLFQGQYKSKLVCPMCAKVSITFDPFMIVPVPLPKKQRLLSVFFFSKDAFRKPVKYMLRLPKDGTVEHLKDAISLKTGVQSRDLKVFEAYKHGIHKFFGKGHSLSSVTASDKIFVCEVLSEKVAGESVVELVILQRVLVPQQTAIRCSYCRRECEADRKLRRCTRCYKTAYCDHSCQKKDWSRHRPMCRSMPAPVGEPFIISLPESQATFSRIVQVVEAFSRYSVDVFQPPLTEDTHSATSPDSLSSMSSLTRTTSLESDLDITPTKSVSSSLSSGSMTEVECSETSSISSEMDSGLESASISTTSTKMPTPEKETDTTEKMYPSLDKHSIPAARGSDGSSPPTRYVLGRQQNTDFTRPPFYLKPVDKDGRGLSASTPEGQRLEDKGEEPLNLSTTYFLAMDWRNNEKSKPYVLVQSKDLDYVEDSSVQTATLEESNITSLDECLSLFTEPEVLSPEHAWYCPSCKEHREATKQLSIWRLPHTLIIQLKRFSFRDLLWRDKIDKLIDFPTRGLDMSKYYIGTCPRNEPPPIYDLCGVINHHGGILGGHYTAYARCSDPKDWKKNEIGWRLFDDSMVSMTSEKQVVTRAAYVLFYRRRDQKITIPRPIEKSSSVHQVGSEKVIEKSIREKDNGSLSESSDAEDSGAFSQQSLARMGGGEGPRSLEKRSVYKTSSLIDMDAVD